ncbi:MAG: 2-amino-4-hydroxy-6-hydroxymethyldihydropteridine diphosphokinase [Tatlockia sp.]|nr:2-amino-4-hydroxy-6-hydroxymethyldihydropteridine diphosphokinase [Tatlockia sp.]
MHQVILSVGSNIHPYSMVYEARNILSKENKLIGYSHFIKTKPDGYQNQDDFLNGAFILETRLGYEGFNNYLKGVEKRLGRIKGPIKSGPRTMDLDIIIWDGKIVHEDFPAKEYIRIPVGELIEEFKVQIEDDHNSAKP